MANVRNFWIQGIVDGRESTVCGGPRRKDGGMSVNIYQRDNKQITTALEINGVADDDGNLTLTVKDKDGILIYELNTKR